MNIAIPLVVIIYYGWLAPWIIDLTAARVAPLLAQRRYAYAATEAVFRLTLASTLQLVLVVLIVLVAKLGAADLGLAPVPLMLLVYGAVLGVGEMVLASFLCHLLINILEVWRGSRAGGIEPWMAMSRSGWMRQYLRTIEVAPWPVALFLICAYVSLEEVVFRAIVIHAFLPARVLAFGASLLLFAAVQRLNMPSWRHGWMPFMGGLTMGVIHAALYLRTPAVAPLIVAHVTFFASAALVQRATSTAGASRGGFPVQPSHSRRSLADRGS